MWSSLLPACTKTSNQCIPPFVFFRTFPHSPSSHRAHLQQHRRGHRPRSTPPSLSRSPSPSRSRGSSSTAGGTLAVTGFDLQAALESNDIVQVKEHLRSLHHLVKGREGRDTGRSLLGRRLSTLAVILLFCDTSNPQVSCLHSELVPVFPTRDQTVS